MQQPIITMKKKLLSIVIMMCMLCTMSVPVFGTETGKTDTAGTELKKAEQKSAQAHSALDSAMDISLNTSYSGSITEDVDANYYRFTLNNSGAVNLQGTFYMKWLYITIFDEAGNTIYRKNPYWNDTTQQISFDEIIHLTSGTYYVCFSRDGNYTGNYNFQLNYTSANESFKETNGGTNNDIPSASNISLNKLYYGQVANNDEKDFYRFSVSQQGKLNIQITAYTDLSLSLYDADGKWVDSWRGYVDSNKGRWDEDRVITLEKSGIYYFAAEKNGSGGNYNFSISSFTPVISVPSSFKKLQDDYSFSLNASVNDSNSELVYTTSNSKVVTVTSYGTVYIEGPGTATITVHVFGSPVKKKVKVAVLPSKISLYSVTGGKRLLKAQWYRNDKASGYQVLTATDRRFTKGKKAVTIGRNSVTAKTIKGLKKNKRYYVKVRAYKAVGKTRLYGAYSDVRVVKVK